MGKLARAHPSFTAFALIAAVIICYLAFPSNTLEASTLQTVCLATITMVGIALLTPDRIGKPSASMARAPLLISICVIAIGVLCAMVASCPSGAPQGLPDWSLLPIILVFCLATGFFEEGFFRGILNDSLIRGFAGTRSGALLAAIISSSIFGILHISGGPVGADSVISLWQTVLKPVQAGLFGFVMVGLYLRTRNITGVALLHALYDLIVLAPSLLTSGTLATGYVTGDTRDLILLILSIVLFVPLAFWAGRSILGNGQPQTR